MSENDTPARTSHRDIHSKSAQAVSHSASAVRPYELHDEPSWLRCRVLAFLDTCYYDDVWQERPADPSIQLVAAVPANNGEGGDEIVGILDVEVDGELATIDTIAVHPDHRREGIADALLEVGLRRLPTNVSLLDAWTREDEPAHAWYRANGFSESDHYLHVYKGWRESADGWTAPPPLGCPVMAFCHADLADEAEARARFARVYVCRRFSRPVVPAAPTLQG
ncbi:GNAT family N-acetyltransferase [Brachybacterium sp. MASK1Z-5]|uniref:GNAT family N-acetyltransferase n=1 Tax=Brachybacterium halotolerans TaxID=2795215 RepID=A0ABS1B6I6_9MICO|nr:GNAT family N-acetyltransferase [Brachybacterium halotolerans]MBK0330236.1 GNAT family N-acetyltransferase [Brachybacterium halotolerans]